MFTFQTCLPLPVNAVLLCQHLPVLAFGVGRVERCADSLSDGVGDFECFGTHQRGEVAVVVCEERDGFSFTLRRTEKQSG